jgi:hypothetical protein
MYLQTHFKRDGSKICYGTFLLPGDYSFLGYYDVFFTAKGKTTLPFTLHSHANLCKGRYLRCGNICSYVQKG